MLSSPRLPTSPGGKGVDGDEDTRSFEALDGWDEPYLHGYHDNGGDGEEDARGGGGSRRRERRATATRPVTGIGVSIEEVQSGGEPTVLPHCVLFSCVDFREMMTGTAVRTFFPVFPQSQDAGLCLLFLKCRFCPWKARLDSAWQQYK